MVSDSVFGGNLGKSRSMAFGNADWFWRMCDVVWFFSLSDGGRES